MPPYGLTPPEPQAQQSTPDKIRARTTDSAAVIHATDADGSVSHVPHDVAVVGAFACLGYALASVVMPVGGSSSVVAYVVSAVFALVGISAAKRSQGR